MINSCDHGCSPSASCSTVPPISPEKWTWTDGDWQSVSACCLSPAALHTIARADSDFPPRKSGLWQVNMTMAGGPMPPQQMKMCIDSKTDADMQKLGMNASQGM